MTENIRRNETDTTTRNTERTRCYNLDKYGQLLACRRHSIMTIVNDQLDAQMFYFIICLLQSSTCFEQRRAHHQEVKFY